LAVVDLASGGETFIAEARRPMDEGLFPRHSMNFAWAGDGSRLFFTAFADSHLCSAPAAGGAATDVSQAVAGSPSISADGRKLAYTDGGRIIVCNPDGTDKQIVFTSVHGHVPEVESFH
jgi:Tol biopolymer transport system component